MSSKRRVDLDLDESLAPPLPEPAPSQQSAKKTKDYERVRESETLHRILSRVGRWPSEPVLVDFGADEPTPSAGAPALEDFATAGDALDSPAGRALMERRIQELTEAQLFGRPSIPDPSGQLGTEWIGGTEVRRVERNRRHILVTRAPMTFPIERVEPPLRPGETAGTYGRAWVASAGWRGQVSRLIVRHDSGEELVESFGRDPERMQTRPSRTTVEFDLPNADGGALFRRLVAEGRDLELRTEGSRTDGGWSARLVVETAKSEGGVTHVAGAVFEQRRTG